MDDRVVDAYLERIGVPRPEVLDKASLAVLHRFQLIETKDGDLDVVRDGKPRYRMELRARAISDFGPTPVGPHF
jgi:hypothetical protein